MFAELSSLIIDWYSETNTDRYIQVPTCRMNLLPPYADICCLGTIYKFTVD